MSDFKTLQPFRFWCQKVLPLVYDDSLSYYELLCKVIDYLNNTIGDVNSIVKEFSELEKYVKNYFKTLDVQDEINNKLDEMVVSGELTDVLSSIYGVLGTGEVSYSLIGNYTSQMLPNGCCEYGNKIYMLLSSKTSDIGKVFIGNKSTGMFEIIDANIGHGNSLCFNTESSSFFCAPATHYDSSGYNKIIEFSQNFTVINEYELSNVYAVTFDRATNKMYAITSEHVLYDITIPENITVIKDLSNIISDDFIQDIACYDNKLYISTPTGIVRCISLLTFGVLFTKYCGSSDVSSKYKIGELEGFEFDTNGELICCAYTYSDAKHIMSFICKLLVNSNSTSIYKEYILSNQTLTINSDSFIENEAEIHSISDLRCMLKTPSRITGANYTDTDIYIRCDIELDIDNITCDSLSVYSASCVLKECNFTGNLYLNRDSLFKAISCALKDCVVNVGADKTNMLYNLCTFNNATIAGESLQNGIYYGGSYMLPCHVFNKVVGSKNVPPNSYITEIVNDNRILPSSNVMITMAGDSTNSKYGGLNAICTSITKGSATFKIYNNTDIDLSPGLWLTFINTSF